jgi:hypothetical protein
MNTAKNIVLRTAGQKIDLEYDKILIINGNVSSNGYLEYVTSCEPIECKIILYLVMKIGTVTTIDSNSSLNPQRLLLNYHRNIKNIQGSLRIKSLIPT